MTEREKGTFERIGRGFGGAAGRAADTGVDLAGTMIRTVGNILGGWWSDRTAEDAQRMFGERSENACRRHFENTRITNKSYEDVRPLYQFGHLARQNPEYQGRSFRDVEADLRTAWTTDQTRKYGDWESVREYVSGGFTARNAS